MSDDVKDLEVTMRSIFDHNMNAEMGKRYAAERERDRYQWQAFCMAWAAIGFAEAGRLDREALDEYLDNAATVWQADEYS